MLTLKFRLKDKHASELARQSRAVNYVWNYCNEMQTKAARAQRKWLSAVEVNEAYTSQTCSACGSLPEGRPKGIAGLEVRQWECGCCGASHDRDVNAALNIARRGLATLAEGAPQ